MKTSTKTFKPTEAVSNNAIRGSGLIQKFNKSTTSALNAKLVKSAELNLEEVKELYRNLSKLEKNVDFLKKNVDGAPNDATLEFLSKGGSAGLAWTRLVLKQQNILKTYTKEILDEELNKEDEVRDEKITVTKSVNEELKQATFVVLSPDEVDLHGDTVSVDEIRKAKESFNKHCMRANLFHLTETSMFSILESYTSPVDFMLDDHFIKKGTWLCTIECHNDDLWDLIKSGDICSVSIGAKARVESVDE